MKLAIDNWRWAGVPFYLRAGKALPKRVTEIAIHFKRAPHTIFGGAVRGRLADEPNVLSIRIQPDEGISLKFFSKVPGPTMELLPVPMEFRYGTSFGAEPPEAYERLILDCLLGDGTLVHARRRGRGVVDLDRPHRKGVARAAAAAVPQLRRGHVGAGGGRSLDRARWARMEKAVMADDTDRLQVFERGGAIEVPVGRIEAELAALWRRAAEARPGQIPNAVTRACLWNLVVRVSGEAQFTHAKHVIDDLSQRHPRAHDRGAHRARSSPTGCARGSRPTGGGAKAAGRRRGPTR